MVIDGYGYPGSITPFPPLSLSGPFCSSARGFTICPLFLFLFFFLTIYNLEPLSFPPEFHDVDDTDPRVHGRWGFAQFTYRQRHIWGRFCEVLCRRGSWLIYMCVCLLCFRPCFLLFLFRLFPPALKTCRSFLPFVSLFCLLLSLFLFLSRLVFKTILGRMLLSAPSWRMEFQTLHPPPFSRFFILPSHLLSITNSTCPSICRWF